MEIKIDDVLKAITDGKVNAKSLAGKLKDIDGAKEVFNNYATIEVEKQLPEKLKTATKGLLDELSKATGVKIEEGENAKKYGSRVATELKKGVEPNDRIKELEAELEKTKNSDKLYQHLKTEMSSLKQDFQTQLKAKDEELKGKVAEMVTARKEAIISADFAQIKRNPSIPEVIFNDWKANQIKTRAENSDLDEAGNIRYKKADGSYHRNSELGYASLVEIMKSDESAKGLFADAAGGGASDKAAPSKDGGQGINKKGTKYTLEGQKTADADTRKVILGVDSFSSKREFGDKFEEAMRDLGVPYGTADYQHLEDQALKEYNYSELPSGL